MATLFDGTVQHQGWSTDNFATGGWQDEFPPLITGLVAGSWWVSPLNGQATDVALRFFEAGQGVSTPNWINAHISSPAQGVVTPPGYVVGPNTRLNIFSRVPRSSDAILLRAVLSDQPVTPAPSTPP